MHLPLINLYLPILILQPFQNLSITFIRIMIRIRIRVLEILIPTPYSAYQNPPKVPLELFKPHVELKTYNLQRHLTF